MLALQRPTLDQLRLFLTVVEVGSFALQPELRRDLRDADGLVATGGVSTFPSFSR